MKFFEAPWVFISITLDEAYWYSLPVSWCLTFEFVISTDTPGSDNGTSLNTSMIHDKIWQKWQSDNKYGKMAGFQQYDRNDKYDNDEKSWLINKPALHTSAVDKQSVRRFSHHLGFVLVINDHSFQWWSNLVFQSRFLIPRWRYQSPI